MTTTTTTKKIFFKAVKYTEIPSTAHTLPSNDTPLFIRCSILKIKTLALSYYHPLQLHRNNKDDWVVVCVTVCCCCNFTTKLCVIQGLHLKLDWADAWCVKIQIWCEMHRFPVGRNSAYELWIRPFWIWIAQLEWLHYTNWIKIIWMYVLKLE